MNDDAFSPAPGEAVPGAVLRDSGILDTDGDEAFTDLVRLACQVTGAASGLIVFFDADRSWVKAAVGFSAEEAARGGSLCRWVSDGPDLMVIEDMAGDARHAGHPWVTGEAGLRFYAGMALRMTGGPPLGVLSVMDRRPRSLSPEQGDGLRIVGRQVMTTLEWRRNLGELRCLLKDHEQAEAALSDSEVLYHSLVDCLPQSIFRKDREGRFLFVNARFCETLGRPPEEIVGRTDFDFFPPELAAKYREDDRRVMETHAVFDTVEEHARPGGERIYVQVLKAPLFDAAGNVIGVQGLFWDVTERKRMEAAIEYERDLLQTLLDSIPDAIYFKDTQSRILRISRALARKFGADDPSEVVGKTDFDFFHEAHARPAYEDEQRILRTGQPLVGLKERETWPDGRVTWALTTKMPLRDRSGAIIGTFGVSKDITDLVAAEEASAKARDAAVESMRVKGQFLANMSHEIRTPMNAIIGMAGLLLETEVTPEQRDCAETIRRSAESLLKLINDILDFSRLEAGRLTLAEEDLDLRDVVEDTVELLAQSAHDRGLELVCRLPPDLPRHVRGDAGRLRQVLTNLIGNAVKFTAKGEVVLSLETVASDDRQVTIQFEISDTGIGIAPEAQERVFEAFSQADISTTRKYGGTGLGLAISRQIVEMMQGRIGVRSLPGVGATFWFTARFGRQAACPGESPGGSRLLEGVRILVVDDNAAHRGVLSEWCLGWAMELQVAVTGAEAIEVLLSSARGGRPFVLAVLDVELPDMDGLGLAEAIQAEPELEKTRLVMLTTLGNRLDVSVMRHAGISACLVKPPRQARFYDALIKVLAAATPTGAQERMRRTGGGRDLTAEGQAGPLRVLVAEDNAINQRLALRQLHRLGYAAEAVANGREVLEALRQGSYDVLLLDCQMPELDGYETARLIRKSEVPIASQSGPSHPPLHIIAMTANAMPGDRDKCLAAGMDDYISKPVRLEDLAAALQRATQGLCVEAAATVPAAATPVAPEAALEAAEPVLDPAVLSSLRQLNVPGQPDAVVEMGEMFCKNAAVLCERIRDAAERGDLEALKAVAHSLKGSAGGLGARRLARLCAATEAHAKAGDLAAARAAAAGVPVALAEAGEALRALTT
ncbi:MAG TPA: PAS domain-containing protein [Verrucomicrobiota bacterium]|nr:PAS domain-containing protein [Verrucomicrobiota bacterium]HNU51555.1 PAS domain-containing protein [Verrucomicrobiota bacterium]